MSKVWITRARPAAQATARRVRALGLEPITQPLLSVRPVGEGPPDLRGAAALAFTSVNAVTAFASRSAERGRQVFTVGAATAAAARQAGFAQVLSADADVEALARLIVTRAADLHGDIVHLGAADVAGDLVGALKAAGLSARRITLYETVPCPPDEASDEALSTSRFCLLHSPRAAQILRARLALARAPGLTALCFSPAVAEPLVGSPLAGLATAPAPTEAALLDLLTAQARRAESLQADGDCGTKAGP